MADILRIQELASTLNLQNIAKGNVNIMDEKLSNLDYLQAVFEKELELRSQNKVNKLKKQSRLPVKEFDYTKISLGIAWQIEKLKTLDFIEENQNIIVLGTCGSGKTSLASVLGGLAIEATLKMFYSTLDSLLEIVSDKEVSAKKKSQFRYIKESDLLIVDDVFYTELSKEEMYLFYRNILFLGEERSIILISNRELSDWTDVCSDQHLMQTFMDRVTQDSQIIRLGND